MESSSICEITFRDEFWDPPTTSPHKPRSSSILPFLNPSLLSLSAALQSTAQVKHRIVGWPSVTLVTGVAQTAPCPRGAALPEAKICAQTGASVP